VKELYPNRPIICIDMRSFYASCMAVLHNLDVLRDCIAIVGNLQQQGSVVLAASPIMKERFGIKTGSRLYDIPQHPDIYLFEPKMAYFVNMSMEITRLLHQFVPQSAIYIYSVDESFIDLTGTEKLWGPPEEVVQVIQETIYRQFHIHSAVGMGPNMLLAKLALDIEAKKMTFAKWTYEDVPEKLWPVTPLSKMWGIGSRMEKNLNELGIFSVGDLANSDLKMLEKQFGVMGNQLYYHAHGIDLSGFGNATYDSPNSYGKGQTLMRDYHTAEEVLTVVLEMCEDIARRARENFAVGECVSLSVSYSKYCNKAGFHRSRTLEVATNDTMQLYAICKEMFDELYDGSPVRRVALSISKLEAERSMQMSFFDADNWKRRKLGAVMDNLRDKYGSTAVLRAVSYTNAGTAIERDILLGGHKR